jgi:hypothetical protein
MRSSHWNKSSKKKPSRHVQEIILIAHEGRSTEANYFGGIKNEGRLSNVHLKGPYSDPKTLVQETIKFILQKNEFNKVYCVFDHDGRKSFELALELIELHNKKHPDRMLIPITSNPCFEIWPLLHYTYTTKSYQTNPRGKSASKALIEVIHNHFPSYSKNSPTIYQELKKHTP